MENLTKRERHIFQLNAYEYRAFIMRSFYDLLCIIFYTIHNIYNFKII